MAERSMEMAFPTVMGGCAISARVYSEFSTFSTAILDGGGNGEKLAREGETDVFFDDFELFHCGAAILQIMNNFFHQIIGRGGPCSETDFFNILQPLRLN